MINRNHFYICSKCGHDCITPLLQNEQGDGLCQYCNGLLLDTGYSFSEYLNGVTPKERQAELIKNLVEPYGLYDINEYNKTEEKINSKNSSSSNNKNNNSVKCPYCQSTNTKKLDVIDRGVSFGFFGFASSKVGKQWHCNNCKSDF